jgi:hypothetical protein
MKIISFCHCARVTPSALIVAVAKALGVPVSKSIMEAEGEAWGLLCADVERESAKPDPRATFDDPQASTYNDSITSLHTHQRAAYIVPVNTDPANAYLRALFLNSVEAVELGQQVWGWDGTTLKPILTASDAECEISA